jgi:hypothetical protein
VNHAVLPISACASILAAVFSVFGLKVTIKFKVQKGPQVGVSFEDDMATSSAIPAVGSAFGDVFFTV